MGPGLIVFGTRLTAMITELIAVGTAQMDTGLMGKIFPEHSMGTVFIDTIVAYCQPLPVVSVNHQCFVDDCIDLSLT